MPERTRTFLAVLLLSAVSAGACYAAAGLSFGLLIGPPLVLSIVLPPLWALRVSLLDLLLSLFIATLPPAAIWLAMVFQSRISFGQWMQCVLILLSLLAASAFAIRLFARIVEPTIAAACVCVASLAWLTWPVWASPWIQSQSIHWPVALHPLLAMNGITIQLGNWTEQRLAYHLTNLGQDVTYAVPMTAFACVAFHVALSIGFAFLDRMMQPPGIP